MMFKFLKSKSILAFILSFVLFPLFCGNTHAVDRHLLISIVGNLKSGKTALRDMLMGRGFTINGNEKDYVPTMKAVREYKPLYTDDGNGTIIMCETWDTSGQINVKDDIINDRCQGSHFIFITFNMALEPKFGFDNVVKQAIAEWAMPISIKYPNSHIVLVGTKSDLATGENLKKIRIALDHAPHSINNLSFLITSSANGEGKMDLEDIIIRNVSIGNLPIWHNQYIAKGASDDADKCTIL